MTPQSTLRLSLPSKGRLMDDSLDFLAECGLSVQKLNPRQYQAKMPALPELTVLFQRPSDIVVSVRQGSVDFGITGIDVLEEKRGDNGEIIVLHDELGYGGCALMLAVPEAWTDVTDIPSLKKYAASLNRPLRVATKFPVLTERFLNAQNIPHTLIAAEGTLETAPTIGYADIISDLVSSGQTLQDNRLRALRDGVVQASQAALIANRKALQTNPQALEMARRLLEYIEAHMRAKENLLVIANMRGRESRSDRLQNVHANIRRRSARSHRSAPSSRANQIKTGTPSPSSCRATAFRKPSANFAASAAAASSSRPSLTSSKKNRRVTPPCSRH